MDLPVLDYIAALYNILLGFPHHSSAGYASSHCNSSIHYLPSINSVTRTFEHPYLYHVRVTGGYYHRNNSSLAIAFFLTLLPVRLWQRACLLRFITTASVARRFYGSRRAAHGSDLVYCADDHHVHLLVAATGYGSWLVLRVPYPCWPTQHAKHNAPWF